MQITIYWTQEGVNGKGDDDHRIVCMPLTDGTYKLWKRPGLPKNYIYARNVRYETRLVLPDGTKDQNWGNSQGVVIPAFLIAVMAQALFTTTQGGHPLEDAEIHLGKLKCDGSGIED